MEDLDFAKPNPKETALSSFRQYYENPQQNLVKNEFAASTSLTKNKDIKIQMSEKGNAITIVDKRMKNLSSDQRKFETPTLKKPFF